MYYVYIIKRKDDELYIGYTADLRKRMKEHNKGKSSAELIYYINLL